jgi:CRP-like cAMP-binding protein
VPLPASSTLIRSNGTGAWAKHPTMISVPTGSRVFHQQVPARLANLIILRLSTSEGIMSREGISIDTPYTHRQLGTMIGANREAVSRAMTELREAGIVEVVGRRIHIRDQDALEREAEARRVVGSLSS